MDRLFEGLPRSLLAEAFDLWASGKVHLRPAAAGPVAVAVSWGSREVELLWRRPDPGGPWDLSALRLRRCPCGARGVCAHEAAAWLALLFDLDPPLEPIPEGMRRLEAQLESLTTAALQAMAHRWRWPLPRGRKAALARRLAARLWLYHRLGRWREGLDADLERLLGLIRLLGASRIDRGELERRWIRWTGRDARAFRLAWSRAIQKGLLIPCELGHEARPRPHAHLPAALEVADLPPPVFPVTLHRRFRQEQVVTAPPLLPLLQETVRWLRRKPIPLAVSAHPQAAALPWLRGWPHDPEEVERLLARWPWSPPPDTWLTVPVEWFAPEAVEEVARSLGLPWEGAAFLLEGLWHLSGLPSGEALPARWAPPEIEGAEATARIAEIWRSGATLFEIAWLRRRDPTLRLVRWLGWSGGMTLLYYEWGLGRQALLRLLEGLPEGWVDWRDVARALEAARPPGFVEASDGLRWRLVRGRGAAEPIPLADHLQAYLEGSLFWMGVVSLAYEEGTLRAFRLTEPGRRWLRGEPLEGLPEEGLPETRWVDARTWSVRPGPETAQLLWLSARMGRPVGSPFVFTADEERIEAVFREGYRPEEILALFEACGLPPTPQLAHMVQEVWARLGRVQVFEGVTLLETEDPVMLQELLAATSLQEAIRGWLAPHLVVIDEDALDRLLKEMRDRGYHPVVVRA